MSVAGLTVGRISDPASAPPLRKGQVLRDRSANASHLAAPYRTLLNGTGRRSRRKGVRGGRAIGRVLAFRQIIPAKFLAARTARRVTIRTKLLALEKINPK